MLQSDVQKDIEMVQAWINQRLQDTKALSYIPFRVMLMIVILDGFAQQDDGYKTKNNQKCFSNFLIKYGGKLQPILDEVCPVTLYYDGCDQYDFGKLKLPERQILLAGDAELSQEADRLMSIVPPNKLAYYQQRHKYAGLVYAMRNKIAHELNYLNQQPNFQENDKEQIPHIATRSRTGHDKNGMECLVFDAWTLHIPILFIERVLHETTMNYFNHCLENSIMPFEKHSANRRCMLAWYD